MLCAEVNKFYNQMEESINLKEMINQMYHFEEKVALIHDFEDQFVPNDNVDTFINIAGSLLEKVIKAVTLQALSLTEFQTEKTPSYNHDLIHVPIELICSIVTKMLQRLSPLCFCTLWKKATRSCGPAVLQLCLLFQDPLQPWACEVETECVNRLLSMFLHVTDQKDLTHCISCITTDVFHKTLRLFLPYLQREKWRKYRPIYCAYQKLIQASTSERLTESLHMILPPILLLVDDFEAFNVVIGLNLLEKTFNSVPAADLRMFGWADVIYEALTKKVYSRDCVILDNSLPCLLSSITILERNPSKVDHQRMSTRYDEAFQVILSSMSTCTQNDILRSYWKYIGLYINAMGITVVRHYKVLMDMLEFQLEFANLQLLPCIIMALETIIQVSWIRMKRHVPMLLKQLLKLSLRLNAEECSYNHFEAIGHCIYMLALCNRDFVKETLSELKSLSHWNEENLQNVICTVQEKISADDADDSMAVEKSIAQCLP